MTDTIVSPKVRAKQWDDTLFREYVRANRFKRYMGSNENAIFQVKKDLTKKKGDAIVITLVGALSSAGGPNNGSTTLVGNEKALPNEGHEIKVGVVRDATVVNVEEEQASPIDIRDAGRVALKDLAMNYLRDAIITALGSINGVAYGTASAAQRNAWNTANADRVLYGAEAANRVAGDHAASLLAIPAGQKLTRAVVSKLKRIAQKAKAANGSGIRPYRYGEDEETFVIFAGTEPYRDLKTDLETVHKDARARSENNPLFTGTTSLYWDGVVIREIPEIESLGAVGAAGAFVAPIYLCGSQALGIAWAKTLKTTIRKEDDYEFKKGVGFMEIRGINKIQWMQGEPEAKDWAVVTCFIAAEPDV
ncbi:DUF4043 family protein [Lysobacter sp. Hz 25]|uniref:phage capsid family protein n=1 Tax=Lysobacter sp. Hz 25 TaxID=3383698 RepID=UPI0038D3D160